jgi:hypothetical protein
LAQLFAGVVANFVLLGPVITTPPGALANAAGSEMQVRLSVVVGIVSGLLTLGLLVYCWPIFRRHTLSGPLLFAAMAVINTTLTLIESGSVLTLLTASQRFVEGGDTAETYRAIGAVMTTMRNSAHYINILIGGLTVLLLNANLYRGSLVPRALAGFGIAAAALQVGAISMPLLGKPVQFVLLAPLAISYIALALWLMAKGFRTPNAMESA